MAYWLFQSNPKYYRLLDAIKDLEQMPWLVTRYGKEMAIADQVIIWMSGTEAGIYALAQIIALPEILTTIPDAQYWFDASRLQGKTQATIKFTHKLIEQPLLKQELKQDPVLKNLLVIRAPNSTNFKVTPEQWSRLQVKLDLLPK